MRTKKQSREGFLSRPWTTGLIKRKVILFYDNTTENKEHTILHSYIQTFRLVTGEVTTTTRKDFFKDGNASGCYFLGGGGRGGGGEANGYGPGPMNPMTGCGGGGNCCAMSGCGPGPG